MRRTKIVATMGPKEDREEILLEVAKVMDVARFNFSHGTREEQKERLHRVRMAAEKVHRPIAMLLDTKGPEIRTGLLTNHEPVYLKEGDTFDLVTGDINGSGREVSVSYKELPEDVKKGDRILIDDGLIELLVENVAENRISCRIENGGLLGEKKGINIPGVETGLPAVTEQDKSDILFGIEEGYDFIAASFIRNADGVREIRKILDAHKSPMKIISKIECQQAVDNFDEILEASDGIMVARGDLGVEVDPKTIPHLQKEMIRKCNYMGKIVITATQMLDSMIRNPRPTRAEVTDVATAVSDDTDAVMLSGETANGKYPVEAIRMMADIVEYAEKFQEHNLFRYRDMERSIYDTIANTTCRSAVTAAHELSAKAIVAPTISGTTAGLLSKYRPDVDIFALSPNQRVVRQMMLLWGVHPLLAKREISTDDLFEESVNILKEKDILHHGDVAVITAGIDTKSHERYSATNIMRIMEID